jgi:hypothetical protein
MVVFGNGDAPYTCVWLVLSRLGGVKRHMQYKKKVLIQDSISIWCIKDGTWERLRRRDIITKAEARIRQHN